MPSAGLQEQLARAAKSSGRALTKNADANSSARRTKGAQGQDRARGAHANCAPQGRSTMNSAERRAASADRPRSREEQWTRSHKERKRQQLAPLRPRGARPRSTM
eukprot:2222483-Alexandrium_andersonii.AAC.1